MNKFLFCISVLFSSLLYGQIKPVISSDNQKVAEPFEVKYYLSKTSKWSLPLIKKKSIIQKDLEIVDFKIDTLSEKIELNIKLIAFDSGIYTIPSYKFKKGVQDISSFTKDINVERVKVNTLQKPIYDIKPLKDVSFTFNDYFNKYRWVLISIIIVVLTLVIGFIIYWIMKARPFSKKEKPEIPPGEEALFALSNLKKNKAWEEDIKQYYSSLTDIIRRYFERKLHFDAPESTSEEILIEMKSQLEEKDYLKLKDLLLEADLVKFAKLDPDASKHAIYLDTSKQLVESLEAKIIENIEEEVDLRAIEKKDYYFDFIGVQQKELPKGEFAIWWKIDDKDLFTNSTTQEIWDYIYEEALIYYPYFLGRLLHENGLNHENEEVFFPKSEEKFIFESDIIGSYIISLSQENGLMILMNTQTVLNEDRMLFLNKLKDNIQSFIKNEIPKIKQNEYKERQSGYEAKQWYGFIKGIMIKSEKEGKEVNIISGQKFE